MLLLLWHGFPTRASDDGAPARVGNPCHYGASLRHDFDGVEHVDRVASGRVRAGGAGQQVDFAVLRVEDVVLPAAVHRVGAAVAPEAVVVGVALERVVPKAAVEAVAALFAVNLVVAAVAVEPV